MSYQNRERVASQSRPNLPQYQKQKYHAVKKTKNLYTLNKDSDGESNDSQSSMSQQTPKQKKINNKQLFNSNQNKLSRVNKQNQWSDNQQSSFQGQIDHFIQNQKLFLGTGKVDQAEGYQQERIQVEKYLQIEAFNSKLQLKLKESKTENSLLEKNIETHQQRQKQIVRRIAKLEVENRQLKFELNKKQQQQQQHQVQVKEINQDNKKNNQLLKEIKKEKLRFIKYTQNLISYLQKCNSSDDFINEREAILTYLSETLKKNNFEAKLSNRQKHKINPKQGIKNTYNYEAQRIQMIKRELEQVKQDRQKLDEEVQQLKKQSLSLQTQIIQMKNQLENQKYTKKKLVNQYSDQIMLLKQKMEILSKKISQQQHKHQRKIQKIVGQISEKNQTISTLKFQLRESRETNNNRKRKNSYEVRPQQRAMLNENQKYRQSSSFMEEPLRQNYREKRKKSFIGDFLHQQQIEMDDPINASRDRRKNRKAIQRQTEDIKKINRQIQELQKQILQEFQA